MSANGKTNGACTLARIRKHFIALAHFVSTPNVADARSIAKLNPNRTRQLKQKRRHGKVVWPRGFYPKLSI